MGLRNPSPPIQKKQFKKRTKARYIILFILFLSTALNYLDRTNISVAAPLLKSDLHLNAVVLGLVFSAFGWTYAIMQIPGGWFLDKFGARLTYGVALAIWSLFTLFQAFARGFGSLFGLRLGLGLSEAPAFPTNNRLVATWFPRHERAFATGFYTAGEYVGLAFLTPVLAWIVSDFSWHAIFIVTGILGLIFVPIWFKFVHDPKDSPYVNDEELAYIAEGGGLEEEAKDKKKLSWSQISVLLKRRTLWGIYIGQFGVTTTLWFFLTWFPTYLVNEKHMTIIHAGFYSMVPYIAAFCGVLFGGAISDWLIRRGVSASISRKTPIIIGLLLACTIVLANYTSSIGLVITIMSVAFFAQGMSGISWTLIGDVAPKELLGLAGGIFNFAGNLSGIVTPIVIGMIVGESQHFGGALIFVSTVALVGALSYLLLVGKVDRIEIESK
ncbi:MFS transporter [Bacillus ginsengihumi]|uniref:Glucarate transporter n=1 Tax=Heyndrickxia ginsengihumi TaxID=363870 RepID=A0A0A6XYS0_9BACI|nr:MFS transporter [Heyndrickxia ginsengihumi]KHD85267.1 glucarate transporter [Heyndrickxia ginsengihumi]NEY19316.1 MFS transporter [Heyndrickxia ginsengihumi]